MPRGGKRNGAGRKPKPVPEMVDGVLVPAESKQPVRWGREAGVPNKSNRALKALAQRFTRVSLATLVQVMRSKDAPPAARVAAANGVLDRGHGRPPQAVTGADGESLSIPATIAFLISQQPGAENRT